MSRERAPVVAITSGKGGVGKSNLAVNLALALEARGPSVLLVDGDLALGSLDVLLGVPPGPGLGSVVTGEERLAAVMTRAPDGLALVPSGAGGLPMSSLSNEQLLRLRGALEELATLADVVVIDTPPGVGENVLATLELADLALLVTSPEPPAVLDAYAVLKLLASLPRSPRTSLVVNGCRDPQEGPALHRQLADSARDLLGHPLSFAGFVPSDPLVEDAVRAGRPILLMSPDAAASGAIRALAARLAPTLEVTAGTRHGPLARAFM